MISNSVSVSDNKKVVNNQAIQGILVERNLNPNMFEFVPKLDAHISVHANWVFGNIYSHHYPFSDDNKKHRDEIARMHHGIQHVTRAAIYIPVFANLYRLFKDEAALKLTDEDIKLLQIAALFHDAARLDDGVDYWDEQSGRMLYEYLIQMGVSKEKALMLADAVANKDRYPAANIYQELLQNADCLDIKRVRKIFDAKFLYFYKNIASENRAAFLLMAKLIIEVHGLIVQQGDYFEHTFDLVKKKQYENKDAYRQIMNDIHLGYPDPLAKILEDKNSILSTYPILNGLSQRLLDLPELENLAKEYLTETNPIMQELNQGKIFFRGIRFPSLLALEKEIKTPEGLIKIETDSNAGFDVRKALRKFGFPTRSKKDNNKLKNGNPNRSVSIAGWGAPILFPAGYQAELKTIQRMEAVDIISGFKKKLHLKNSIDLSRKEQKKQKRMIRNLQQMGGVAHKDNGRTNNETLGCIIDFRRVIFTLDHCMSLGEKDIVHPLVPILEAIFLQNEYYLKTKELLPIYRYSAVYNFLILENFTKEQVIKIWNRVCVDYMEDKNNSTLLNLLDSSVESILQVSLYGAQKGKVFLDPLCNYPQALRNEIQKNILEEKNQIIRTKIENLEKHFLRHTTEEFIQLPSSDLLLLSRSGLLKKKRIRTKILEFLNSDALLQYIKGIKFQRFDVSIDNKVLNDYCITIKKGSNHLTLMEDPNATEEEKKLYYLMLISEYLTLPKITQEIQNSVLKNCFSHLTSYRADDILQIFPHDAVLSLYIATIFQANKDIELLTKVKQYIRSGIEYSQLFGDRFKNKIYTTAISRRRIELSLICSGIQLLSFLSYSVQEEIDLLLKYWVSQFSIFQCREIVFFERNPQFSELDIWPQHIGRTDKYIELSNNSSLIEPLKECFEISIYFYILTDMLKFLKTNLHLDIEKKGEETHYQKILGCFVAEILRQMPKHESTSVEEIICFFNKASTVFLDHAGLFLKLLQHIEKFYPSFFKQYQEAILDITKKTYFDQFKEIEDFYKLNPVREEKSDIELKSPSYDSKEGLHDPKASTPKLLTQQDAMIMVDQKPRRYYFFSEIKPATSGAVQLLECTMQGDQIKKEEDMPPILCAIV